MVENQGLYRPEFEHDACGIGFRANIKGRKSHQIVADAIHMLERMEHRGATGFDPNTGDGAGILIQIPHEFFVEESTKLGFHLPPASEYGVGMIFFPGNELVREECREILNRKIKMLGLQLLGYRKVPTLNNTLGEGSLSVEPNVEQVFIKRPDDITDDMAFERKLFILRQVSARLIKDTVKGAKNFYYSSLSCRTISYKGQLTTAQIEILLPGS